MIPDDVPRPKPGLPRPLTPTQLRDRNGAIVECKHLIGKARRRRTRYAQSPGGVGKILGNLGARRPAGSPARAPAGFENSMIRPKSLEKPTSAIPSKPCFEVGISPARQPKCTHCTISVLDDVLAW